MKGKIKKIKEVKKIWKMGKMDRATEDEVKMGKRKRGNHWGMYLQFQHFTDSRQWSWS